jgi:hypothetical protein
MKKEKKIRKLVLNRETVRHLTDAEVAQAVAGEAASLPTKLCEKLSLSYCSACCTE